MQETHTEAAMVCCEAGMKLVSIETAAEHECLTQLNNSAFTLIKTESGQKPGIVSISSN